MNKLLTITSYGAAITWNVIFISVGVFFIKEFVKEARKAK